MQDPPIKPCQWEVSTVPLIHLAAVLCFQHYRTRVFVNMSIKSILTKRINNLFISFLTRSMSCRTSRARVSKYHQSLTFPDVPFPDEPKKARVICMLYTITLAYFYMYIHGLKKYQCVATRKCHNVFVRQTHAVKDVLQV